MTDLKTKILKYFKLAFLFFPLVCFAQNSSSQWGGMTDIFDSPVGARAMAMGGAYVSVANDPFALYWNPAALDQIPQMGLGFYYSNLPAGTQYNYFSYAYPTLTMGTMSVGILRLSTGDITVRDDDATKLGSTNYSRTLFLFGYGYQMLDWMSLGATFKLERVDLPGYADNSLNVSNITESGFGTDVGILLSPFNSGVLGNVKIGLNIQNFIQRSIRAIEDRETTPRNYRFGLSKTVVMSNPKNYLTFAFEMDVNERQFSNNFNYNIPTQYHMGVEYDFNQNFMLRLGYDMRPDITDTKSAMPTYGFGLKFVGFELDYSYWNGWDSLLGSSHRLSFVMNIGKDREQRLAEIREKEIQRIQEEVYRQKQLERQNAIVSGMARANQFFESKDYARAFTTINKVLTYDESGDDPELADARDLLSRINMAIKKQQEEENLELLKRDQEAAARRRQQQLVEEHYNKAMGYFADEEYPDALLECERALEVEPNSEIVKELRDKITEDLKQKLKELLENAKKFEERGQRYEAVNYYNRARRLARGNKQVESYIANRLNRLELRLNNEDKVRRAAIYERDKNWKEAAALYEDALKSDPNNKELQKKYKATKQRAEARQMKMTPEVKDLYTKGVMAYTKGDFKTALDFYQKALDLQPNNISILRALDAAVEKLRQQKTN